MSENGSDRNRERECPECGHTGKPSEFVPEEDDEDSLWGYIVIGVLLVILGFGWKGLG